MENIDKSWKGFYKFSGIAWIAGALLFFIYIVLGMFVKYASDSITAEQLSATAQHHGLIRAQIAVYLTSVISYFVAVPGLYLSLKELKKNWILPGAALFLLVGIFDAILRIVFYAVTSIAINYGNTTNDYLKAGYISVAEFVSGIASIVFPFITYLYGIAAIVTGIAMFSGVYHKRTAYILLGSGVFWSMGGIGFVTLPILLALIQIGSLLFIMASVLIGLRLIAIDRAIA